MTKKEARIRRAKKTRYRIADLGVPRLTIHRSSQHIYAQLIVAEGLKSKVVAAASTLEKELREKPGTKQEKAKLVGQKIAERIIKAGIKKVAFDRSGFKYHGRVKALAESAREGGVDF